MELQMSFLGEDSGADFSPCRKFRFALFRQWDKEGKTVAFIGLNPSTADEAEDDPTIRRCVGFAKSWGFGRLVMLNAFAFRSTNPNVLKTVPDPVGYRNDEAIVYHTLMAEKTIAAWGQNCPHGRAVEVCDLVEQPVYCLGYTKTGQPKHPLYLPRTTIPELYTICKCPARH